MLVMSNRGNFCQVWAECSVCKNRISDVEVISPQDDHFAMGLARAGAQINGGRYYFVGRVAKLVCAPCQPRVDPGKQGWRRV